MASEKKKYVETPLMKQYYAIKVVHQDAILLFRVGDFYETFGEDAVKASSILGITLTKRANGAASSVELAGFPYHAVDTYLPKLVRAGERVAICEQLEDPKTTKKIVRRGVVELVTPGVALSDNILSTRENTFLGAVYFGSKGATGVSFLDLSTGEFYAAEGSKEYIDKLLSNFAPKEIIYQRGRDGEFREAFGTKYYTYKLDEWGFTEDLSRDRLCKQLEVKTLKGYGIEELGSAIAAAGAILYYLEFTEHRDIKHIRSISRIDQEQHVWIDRFTIRNLELFAPSGQGEGRSFTGTIDKTLSPMGSRLLKRWVALPIRDVKQINQRLDIVGRLKDDEALRESIGDHMSQIGDLERIVSRIAAMRVTPRELVQLRNSLHALERLKTELGDTNDANLCAIADSIELAIEVRDRIAREVYPDPSNQIAKGGVIADGVNLELDDLRRISLHGKDLIAEIQRRESEATGIPSLKVSFNNVFGYYIEVRNTHKDKVPEGWIRKQTLTSAERYVTAELKEYEEKILGAQEKILILEQQIYNDLLQFLLPHLHRIQHSAATVARLDCLLSFATLASQRGYCRPEVNESLVLDIKAGRHPVIETLMGVGEAYVPNDVFLDDRTQQIMMITGPNMSGKSALLRQTALIVLMAQMGCYVPASSAHIGVVDKIFTRVGASDNISQGESTFMVEMLESATILNNLSSRSLLLLDEIGRGTSTYDGISIAWAIVEYIHGSPTCAKTLFATHYHELNEMESIYERIKNYNVSVKEIDRSVVFMRKLMRGGTEHSFGIHVAKMAGMPRNVVDRAGEILKTLEHNNRSDMGAASETVAYITPKKEKKPHKKNSDKPDDIMQGLQLSMFQLDDPVLKQIRDQIKGLDVDNLTPIEALNMLSEIKKITGL